tara:strand:- start:581 stop:1579 length:999 start_codon:yes stop_codon:yes gene_type:complete
MDIFLNIIILILSFIFVGISSNIVVNSSDKVSQYTGISKTVIGFLLISLTTSLPELSVTIISTYKGEVNLALGNIIGSNIANIGLVIAVPFFISVLIIFLRKQKTQELIENLIENKRSIVIALGVSIIIPVILLALNFLNFLMYMTSYRFLGIILVILYFVISYFVLKSREVKQINNDKGNRRNQIIKHLSLIIIGISIIVISSNYLVESAISISRYIGISELVIGAVIIAIGTSIPELAISLSAILHKHRDLALGNAAGSCFTNITLILGILFILTTQMIDVITFYNYIIFSIILSLILIYYVLYKHLKFPTIIVMILIYSIFIFVTLNII